MEKEKVIPINKNKDLPKAFCTICGRYVDELKDVPIINLTPNETLMMKMCHSCEIVVYNFVRMINQAMQQKMAKQQERRIIIP